MMRPFRISREGFFIRRPITTMKKSTFLQRFFAITLLLPTSLNPLKLPALFSLPDYQASQESKKEDSQHPNFVAFDQDNPWAFSFVAKNWEISLNQSYFDKEIEAKEKNKKERLELAKRDRDVVARERTIVVHDEPDLTLEAKRALVQKAASSYNIPWQILEAIWQVETGKSWDTARRSSKGAAGPLQFLPSTWQKFAVDGNGDGKKEITSGYDALYSAAHYLAVSGASIGQIEQAIFRYNPSPAYLRKVLRIARELGYQKPPQR